MTSEQLGLVVSRIRALSASNAPVLVTIDGPCGAGKSTLAEALRQQTGVPVLHMDDYYIPMEQKTPARLAIPGGNADVERFTREFLLPWVETGTGVYRPYHCHENRYDAPMVIHSHVVVVEGCYVNLPAIATHAALRLFMQVSPQTQLDRLRTRNGEAAMAGFLQRWIPLERAYFAAYGLPDAGCVLLTSQ